MTPSLQAAGCLQGFGVLRFFCLCMLQFRLWLLALMFTPTFCLLRMLHFTMWPLWLLVLLFAFHFCLLRMLCSTLRPLPLRGWLFAGPFLRLLGLLTWPLLASFGLPHKSPSKKTMPLNKHRG